MILKEKSLPEGLPVLTFVDSMTVYEAERAVVSAALAYREAQKAYSEIPCAARYDTALVAKLRWREATDALLEAMKK